MKALLFLLSLMLPLISFAQPSLSMKVQSIKELANAKDEISIDVASVEAVSKKIWEKHVLEQKNDPKRIVEIRRSYVEIKGKKMKYAIFKKGEKPSKGYPLYIALHGGGGAPDNVNNQQWKQMKSYYLDSIKTGIYIVPRGISNSWNLHFKSLSYPLYDLIIDNLILMNLIDPNKVFFLGFSAGGDGVYQIAPKMADRLAGASMSAGHPNGISPINLFTVPFVIQMGENDASYNRNKEAAVYHSKLELLRTKYGKGYVNELFLHKNGTHNSPWRDNNPNLSKYSVITNPKEWYSGLDSKVKNKDSNSIRWLNKFTRDPNPNHLIWDSDTRAGRRGSRSKSHYWLSSENPKGAIAVSFKNNTFFIHEADVDFKIWIDPDLVDLNKKVVIMYKTKEVYNNLVTPNINSIAKSIIMKNDPELIYVAEIPINISKTNM